MWILQLNPMMGNHEQLRPVARAETREQLEQFLQSQAVDSYTDDDGSNMCGGKLRKSFRKGGRLEYFNPPDRDECFVEVRLDDWIERTRQRYSNLMMEIPSI